MFSQRPVERVKFPCLVLSTSSSSCLGYDFVRYDYRSNKFNIDPWQMAWHLCTLELNMMHPSMCNNRVTHNMSYDICSPWAHTLACCFTLSLSLLHSLYVLHSRWHSACGMPSHTVVSPQYAMQHTVLLHHTDTHTCIALSWLWQSPRMYVCTYTSSSVCPVCVCLCVVLFAGSAARCAAALTLVFS